MVADAAHSIAVTVEISRFGYKRLPIRVDSHGRTVSCRQAFSEGDEKV